MLNLSVIYFQWKQFQFNISYQLMTNVLNNLNIPNTNRKFQRQDDIITPQDYNLPTKITNFDIQNISWRDFKGSANPQSPYSAHIYWRITYELVHTQKAKLNVKVIVKILPKSWVLPQNKSKHLLRHEYGHYLIGCLCALTFQKRINKAKKQPSAQFWSEWCKRVFDYTLKQFLKWEIMYDQQTHHRLHQQKQQEWEGLIAKRFNILNQQLKQEDQKKQFKIRKLPNTRSSNRSINL